MPRHERPQQSRLTLWHFLILLVSLACLEVLITQRDKAHTEETTLHKWLGDNKLAFLQGILQNNDINSIAKFLSCNVDDLIESNALTSKQKQLAKSKFEDLQNSNAKLIEWLETYGLEKYLSGFYDNGCVGISYVKDGQLDNAQAKKIIERMGGGVKDYKKLVKAIDELNGTSKLWYLLLPVHFIYFILWILWFVIKWGLQLMLVYILYTVITKKILTHYRKITARRPQNIPLPQFLFGNFLSASSCTVDWLWEDNTMVGNSAKFILKLQKKNPLLAYKISGREDINIEVHNGQDIEEVTREDLTTYSNACCITFHPKKSGNYKISIVVNGERIPGSPFTKKFLPGPVVTSNISILSGISMIVVAAGVYYPLKVETKDKYYNICELKNKDLFQVNVTQVGCGNQVIDPELVIFPEHGRNMLHIKVDQEGCFQGHVTYQDQPISNGSFSIISLNAQDTEVVEKAMLKNNWYQTWFEGYLIPSGYQALVDNQLEGDCNVSSFSKQCRKVYFYFSSRQLSIKEFYLKFFPSRLYTFRISPLTKIVLPEHISDSPLSDFEFKLDDGIQPPVSFLSQKRSLIMATFAQMLHRNIGGADSFQDKKRFFYRMLQSHHDMGKFSAKKANLTVNRWNILESSYEATKNFSISKWCRHFSVTFNGEEGYDAGGVTREWMTVLSAALFDPKNNLFTQFNKTDKQALVYPNPTRPPHLKLKYFEFAGRIVGKCIFESSCSSGRRLNVKARFMRSFLAQLLGLRVNYKYFKTDDKQLYTSKIQYIQENDPEDLDLVFIEEDYDCNGKLIKEYDLLPNGKTIPVTEQNKMQYLDCLAQYRLSTRISAEIYAFVKGLNDLVPDNFLVMFSEQELELLICGTTNISVSDLKKHHTLFSSEPDFYKVMTWFWKTVALFSQEEIAQLLQFTTGSSQLPPGGFAHLTPTFSFMSSHLHNALPRAHTCFNQLVLPSYSTFEEFDRCLRLAITEGCEGFGFA